MHLIDLILQDNSITLTQGSDQTVISSVRCDSRTVDAGTLFVCISGEASDGHDFIADACSAGASAILTDGRPVSVPDGISIITTTDVAHAYSRLCSRFWPRRSGMLVGVTGTNGKTSVCEYLRQIWQRATWPAAAMGTLGITCPTDKIADTVATLTTPQAETLFSNLDQLANAGISHTAFEASSHGLAQGRLSGLGVNVAVFTNLTRDHLDWHSDMDDYFDAKARLFDENLMDGGIAVINNDDEHGKALIKRLAGRPIVIWTVGMSPESAFCIKDITPQSFGLDLSLSHQGQTFHFPIALSGQFQAVNAVMAGVAAYASGMPLQDSFGALPSLQPVRGRMQPVHGHPLAARIIIDYAHTPDALDAALDALRVETRGKLFVVFGCGGDRDKGKRVQMGQVAADKADHVIITDDNPRTEDPALIREEIRTGCPDSVAVWPRDDAIRQAISGLSACDSLLIAGKGHETVQMIGTETLPFDDAAVARNMLAQLQEDAAC